jgi:hypothetical protein
VALGFVEPLTGYVCCFRHIAAGCAAAIASERLGNRLRG